jgi:GT2 family glycosyltransferase
MLPYDTSDAGLTQALPGNLPSPTRNLPLPASISNPPSRVTAVVLNWCDAPATEACVRSLQADGYPELTILVVDNASPDGSGAWLQRILPEVDFLQTGENLGYSGGNNRGIERALSEGAEFVLVLNPDTLIEPGTLTRLVSTAQETPRTAAVVPTVVRMDDPDKLWYDGGAFDPVRGLGIHWNGERLAPQGDGPRDVTFFTGCSVLLSAEAIREVGAFPEEYFLYVEDAELSVRLVRSGWRIIHEPRVRIRHFVPPDDADPSPAQIRFRDRNRRRLVRKHLGGARKVVFAAWFYPTRIAHLGRYLMRGDLSRASAIVRGMVER